MTLTLETYKEIRGYRAENGKFYPSVSAVLDLLFPTKMEWIDQAALDEGTRCHADMKAAMQTHIERNTWLALNNHRAAALVDYLATHDYEPAEAETARRSEVYGFAGTPDALLRRKGKYVLADWKFAESIDPRYSFQLEAYRRLYDLDVPLNNSKMLLFRVDKRGHVDPFAVTPSQKHWTLFLNALACLKFRLR